MIEVGPERPNTIGHGFEICQDFFPASPGPLNGIFRRFLYLLAGPDSPPPPPSAPLGAGGLPVRGSFVYWCSGLGLKPTPGNSFPLSPPPLSLGIEERLGFGSVPSQIWFDRELCYNGGTVKHSSVHRVRYTWGAQVLPLFRTLGSSIQCAPGCLTGHRPGSPVYTAVPLVSLSRPRPTREYPGMLIPGHTRVHPGIPRYTQ